MKIEFNSALDKATVYRRRRWYWPWSGWEAAHVKLISEEHRTRGTWYFERPTHRVWVGFKLDGILDDRRQRERLARNNPWVPVSAKSPGKVVLMALGQMIAWGVAAGLAPAQSNVAAVTILGGYLGFILLLTTFLDWAYPRKVS